MMKSKKGMLFGAFVDTIIFATLFVAFLFFTWNIFENNRANSFDIIDQLEKDMFSVAGEPVGSSRTVQVELAEDSAIIGFNPGSDFLYFSQQDKTKINKELLSNIPNYFFAKGFFMDRPGMESSCHENSPCLCLCEGYYVGTQLGSKEYPQKDAHIGCEDISCKSLENIQFKEQMKITEVFDDEQRGTPDEFIYPLNRADDYWDNSFILLRTDLINIRRIVELSATKTAAGTGKTTPTTVKYPLVVSGYRDMRPLSIMDVTIISYGDNTVGVCLKSKCVGVTDPTS